MNTLSLFIYLAGVINYFDALLFFSGFLSLVVGTIYTFATFSSVHDKDENIPGFKWWEEKQRLLNTGKFVRGEELNKQLEKLEKEFKEDLAKDIREGRFDGRTFSSIAMKPMVITLSLLLLSGLIPSQTTLYMIAASEIGEQALLTEEGKKVQTIINKYLDGVITEFDLREQELREKANAGQ